MCPLLVCLKIDKIDSLFNYVGVNLRVTFEGIVVSFPSGYGVTESDETQLVFNSFNSVIGEFEKTKRVLLVFKEPMPFSELRTDVQQQIKHAVQELNKDKIPLTKEMIESSAFPLAKFDDVFHK